ncbi:MAG TPA: YIP1 family protein [Kiritimatiellia bacterium]|nr:YIP1 family protein [Kiritimatiellia bacterium]HMP00159.1 YIP1 family protein [Kiritimatiellia bacterium]
MNETINETAVPAAFNLETIKKQALAVITNPVEFYRTMPIAGGFKEPLLFLVAMSLVTGILRAILMIGTSFAGALGMLVVTPILAAIFGFVGAAIVFLVWKLMGSGRDYETAYRCFAYAAAISPITALLSYIPYLGGVAATGWGLFLLYAASITVHGIAVSKAKMVWGILFAVFALVGISTEAAGRRAAKNLERFQQQVGQQIGREDMTPEEAGRMLGEFLRGMEKSSREQQQ